MCPPLGLEEQTDDATFGGRQGWDPVHVISGLLSLQIGRFGPNKCGKVLEAEVDQIYTLCMTLRDSHESCLQLAGVSLYVASYWLGQRRAI